MKSQGFENFRPWNLNIFTPNFTKFGPLKGTLVLTSFLKNLSLSMKICSFTDLFYNKHQRKLLAVMFYLCESYGSRWDLIDCMNHGKCLLNRVEITLVGYLLMNNCFTPFLGVGISLVLLSVYDNDNFISVYGKKAISLCSYSAITKVSEPHGLIAHHV